MEQWSRSRRRMLKGNDRCIERSNAAMRITTLLLPAVLCCACGRGAGQHTTVQEPDSSQPMNNRKVYPANELGFARVTTGEGATHAEGVIDAKGIEIIPPLTSILVDDITGSTALVRTARGHLFVGLENGPVDTSLFATTRGFQYAEPFRCGRAMVQVDDRRFYIDEDGNRLFGEDYDHAETFHHGRAMVMQEEKYRIIDTTGQTIARMNYYQVNPYSEWRWQVSKMEGDVFWSGFVDLDGKEVVPLIYTQIGMFQRDVSRTWVAIRDKVGFLDEYANAVIPVRYEEAEMFQNRKARVRLNGRDFYIDPDGKEVQ